MERYDIVGVDGEQVSVFPTASDGLRARRAAREFTGMELGKVAVGDIYLFTAFEAAKRAAVAGADEHDSCEEWGDTIREVRVEYGVEAESTSAEGEDGPTPASSQASQSPPDSRPETSSS